MSETLEDPLCCSCSKIEVVQDLADCELMFNTAAIYLNND